MHLKNKNSGIGEFRDLGISEIRLRNFFDPEFAIPQSLNS
jgi:hypothetical protein